METLPPPGDDDGTIAPPGGTVRPPDGTVAPPSGTAPTAFQPPRPSSSGRARPPERIGHYVIERELARGGMGVVYIARHAQLGRRVALKLMLGEADERSRQRFATEARALARIQHPGVVRVHDVGETPAGPYMAMNLVEGESLKSRVRREGPLDPREAAALTVQIATAMQAVHDKGLLHRDMKPDNVLLDGEGRPLITDFGLAKDQSAKEQLTRTGQMLGTPAFMPPEQADGDLRKIDHRADVYGIGAMLYALLTGQPPFQGETPLNLIHKLLTEPPRPPSEVREGIDRDLETIVLKCLEKERRHRYFSARDLADDLARYLRNEPVATVRPSAFERLRRAVARNAGTLAAAAAGVVVLTVIASLAAVFVWPRVAHRYEQSRVTDWIDLGDTAYREENYPLAVEHYSSAIKVQKDDAGLYLRRGEALFKGGDAVAALADYERSAELVDGSAEVHLAKAKALLHVEGREAAMAELAVARGIDPNAGAGETDPEGLFLRGARAGDEALLSKALQGVDKPLRALVIRERASLKHASGRYPAASGDWTAAIRIDETDAAAYLGRARSRFESWSSEQASGQEIDEGEELRSIEEDLQAAMVHSPTEDVLRGCFDLYVALEDMEGRLEALNHLVARFKTARDYRARAALRGHLGEAEAALEDYQAALDLEPNDASTWVLLARLEYNNKRFDAAIEHATRAVRLDPLGPEGYAFRGMAHYLQRNTLRLALADGVLALAASPVHPRAHGLVARCLNQEGLIEQGLQHAYAAVRLGPNEPWALLCRAILLQEVDRHEQAVDDLTRAVALSPGATSYYRWRAVSYIELEEYDLARRDLDAVLRRRPAYARAYYTRARLAKRTGDTKGAVRDLERAIQLDSGIPQPFVELGCLLYAQGQSREGNEHLSRAIALGIRKPDRLAQWHTWRGMCRLALGESHDALRDFRKALELSDGIRFFATINSGDAHRALGNRAQALEAYAVALTLAPEEHYRVALRKRTRYLKAVEALPPGPEATVAALVDRARGAMMVKDYVGAETLLAEALVLAPDDAPVHHQRGKLLVSLDKIPEAEKAFSAAIKAGGVEPIVYQWRGRARVRLGDYEGGIEDLERFLALAPEHQAAETAREQLAQARGKLAGGAKVSGEEIVFAKRLLAQAKYAEARLVATRLLERDPRSEQLLKVRIQSQLAQGLHEGAEADCRALLAVNPRSHQGHVFLGVSCFKQGRYEEAVEAATGALAIDDSIGIVYSNRAAAYRRLGRPERALADLNKALDGGRVGQGYVPNAYRVRGDIHLERKELHLALRDYRAFVRLAPTAEKADHIREEIKRLQIVLKKTADKD